MKDLFLNEKPVMALVTIRRSRDDIYGSIVSREIDTTYAHAVKIISKLEDRGLVESSKEGRKKILKLTEEGETYADLFIEMLDNFENDDVDVDLTADAEDSSGGYQFT
jgi:predicted transcriptional regulator